MPTPTKLNASHDVERVLPEYSSMLAQAVAAAGLERKELEAGGKSGSTIWRVLNHKEDPSLAAAERVRQRILELRPSLDLPPPAVRVMGHEHYEWMRMGTELMTEDIVAFRRVLATVRQVYKTMRQARAAIDELQRLALKPDSGNP